MRATSKIVHNFTKNEYFLMKFSEVVKLMSSATSQSLSANGQVRTTFRRDFHFKFQDKILPKSLPKYAYFPLEFHSTSSYGTPRKKIDDNFFPSFLNPPSWNYFQLNFNLRSGIMDLLTRPRATPTFLTKM